MNSKFYSVSGYNEVGKNMSVLQLGEEAIAFDMGLYLPPIVELEEKNKFNFNERDLRNIGALPNDLILGDLRRKIKTVCVSHGHLDHLGAVPHMIQNYNAEVAGTPYTMEILKSLYNDSPSKSKIKIKTRSITPNSSFNALSKNYEIEFLNITHSIPQASLIVVHTPKGAVVYANDFKFDNNPIIGKRPSYERIREIGKEGVLALVVESLYAGHEGKTPSEKIARGLLEDVLLTTDNQNYGIVVTTFSSHIARLKSIVDCAKQLNRKVLFVGRSLHKYVTAANNIKIVPFMSDINLITYRDQLERKLKKANQNKKEWMVVCTGHQGEPGSILERISRGALPYKLNSGDHVVYSSKIIPAQVSIDNRAIVDRRLKEKGVRIFSDVHVSGHCSREDLRDFINMLNPKHIIPAHGELEKRKALSELASELGYSEKKDLHLMNNGESINL